MRLLRTVLYEVAEWCVAVLGICLLWSLRR